MQTPSLSSLSKGFGIFVLLCGSVWSEFSPDPKVRSHTKAAELFALACTALGFSRDGSKLRQDVTEVKVATTGGAAPPDPAPTLAQEHFERGL